MMNRLDMRNPQRINLRNLLLDGPVCGLTRNPYIGARLSARVLELRQLGFPIETRRCTRPSHAHRTKQIEYVLTFNEYHRPNGEINRCPYCGELDLKVSHVEEHSTMTVFVCVGCDKSVLG